MMGRQKKQGNQFLHSKKSVPKKSVFSRKQILRSRLQQNKDKLWQRIQ
jgi:hypothetical protein